MRVLRSRPLILLFVVVGAFVIMFLDAGGQMGPFNDAIQRLLRPFDIAFTEARSDLAEMLSTARDLRTLRRENSELQALVERLTVENLELAEVRAENEKLRAFFAFAQVNPTYNFRGGQIIARAIGVKASPYADTLQIDLGAEHGIRLGMPVVTDRGLVGRIAEVFSNSSTVLLLSDPNSSINVMTQSSRAPGTLNGRAGQDPVMDFIPPDMKVAVGEIVITSGLGGNFPKGLVVGQITEVLHSDNQPFQRAVVRPTVDFDRLELVLVITSFTPYDTAGEPAISSFLTPTPAPTP